MAESPEGTLKYAPKVNVKVVGENGREEGRIDLPVPAGQEWLYVMLEKQQKSIRSIRGWMTFFGILTILSIVIILVWTYLANL